MKPSFLIKPLVLMMATLGVSSFANDNTPMVDLGSLEITGSHSSPYVRGSSSSATGLNLKLQETPQSVSVITKELLQDKKMDKITDTLTQSTGVYVSPVDGVRSRIAVRGFGNTEQTQINGVKMVSGGIGDVSSLSLDMYERIEITRGATGLLTGAGEPSASINLIRKQANSRELKGGGSLALGSWGHKKIVADVQSPLNADGSIRGRIVASHLMADSFRDWEKRKHSSVYATLDADVGDDTDVSVGVSLGKNSNKHVSWLGLPLFYADGTRTDWASNKSIAAHWSDWQNRHLTVFADAKHRFAGGIDWQTSALYHRANDSSQTLWTSGTPERETGQGMMGNYDYYFSPAKHLQLESKVNVPFTAFNQPQELLIGISHGQTLNHWDSDDNDEELELGNIHQWQGQIKKPAHRVVFGSEYQTTQNALYVSTRLQLDKAFKIIAGSRFTHYKDNAKATKWGTPAYTQKETALTPYLGVVYDVSKDHSVYASFTNIFKPQDNKDKNGKFLAPVKGNSYEVGLKNQWLDGNLNTNFALYQTVQDNFAQPDGKIGNTDQDAFKAIKGATIRGFEAEAVGRITPQWDLMASFSVFKSNKTPDGEELVSYAPRQTFKLFSKYDLSSYVDGLSVGGGLNWYSQPPKILENPKTQVKEKVGNPAYALIDVMAKYQINDKLSAQVNVNNVLDTKYYHVNDWFENLNYGEPRNFKVGVGYVF